MTNHCPDPRKWWICRLNRKWMIIPPFSSARAAHSYPTGAEALAAFARGKA